MGIRMKKIGFLGFGKIARAIYEEMEKEHLGQACFIQDIKAENLPENIPYISAYEEKLYEEADLIIEGATASVLGEQIEHILSAADLMLFSVTAFANEDFRQKAFALAEKYGHHIYLPHGAILGLDGILDGAPIWTRVQITTTKNPASLGRTDAVKTVLYDGPTRGACEAYPRNVNVHAAVALLGIGFDETHSTIIADPSVHTNAHVITLSGPGIEMELHVTSTSTGGVTGNYTPLSAQGSLKRILGNDILKIV